MKKWQQEILERGELYLVGGAVRDRLIGRPRPKDNDYLVRCIEAEEFERLLLSYGSVKRAGHSFQIFIFKPHNEKFTYDIALPRKKFRAGEYSLTECDPFLPVREDLLQRDFTVNAIAYDMRNKEYIAPHSGMDDLREGIIRMVSPTSLESDPVRMLRGVFLTALTGFRIDAETLTAIKNKAPLIKQAAPERIKGEMDKLLCRTEAPGRAIELTEELGLMKFFMPELAETRGVEQNRFHPHMLMKHTVLSCEYVPRERLRVRWAALLHDLGKADRKIRVEKKGEERTVFYGHEKRSAELAETVMERLKFGRRDIRIITRLIGNHMFNYESSWTEAAVRRFIRRVGKDNIENLLTLRQADRKAAGRNPESRALKEFRRRIEKILTERPPLAVKDLQVNGNDVMKIADIGPGPGVGKILGLLMEAVTEDPRLNSRETLLSIIAGFISDSPDGNHG